MLTLLRVATGGPWRATPNLVLKNDMSDRQALDTIRKEWARMYTILLGRGGERRPSFAYFLFVHCRCECSEPRDGIFSLLNICEPIEISVDYRKPVADIFINTTRSIIDQEQNLNIICSAQLRMEIISRPLRNIQMPSWVPNYASELKAWTLSPSQPGVIYTREGDECRYTMSY
jgi:hypothetical protein